MKLLSESSTSTASVPGSPGSDVTISYPNPYSGFSGLHDNSKILSFMHRMGHSADSILQLSRELLSQLEGVLDKAQILWVQVDTAPSSWDIPIEHSKIPTLCYKQSIRIIDPD